MLAQAQALNPDIEYLPGDIRSLRLGRTFDAVLLHDACAYLTSPEDLRAAYVTAATHLRPGGVLLTVPEELRCRFSQHRVVSCTRTVGDHTVTTLEVDFDPDPQDAWYERTFVYLIRTGDDLKVEIDRHRLGLFDLEEVLDLLRQAGFEPRAERWQPAEVPADEKHYLVLAVLRRLS